MSKRAFDKIAEGLDEAVAIARGAKEPARLHVPAEMDVRAIRMKTGLSQDGFAGSFGFSIHQVRQWEQARNRPLGAMRAYLMVIDSNHEEVLTLLRLANNGGATKAA